MQNATVKLRYKLFVFAVCGSILVGGCKSNPVAHPPGAKAIFLADLRAKGITLQEELPDNGYVLAMNGFTITVGFENTMREYEQSHDPEVIHRFTSKLDGQWPQPLTWERAKTGLLYIAEQANIEIGDSIKAPVAGKVIKALEYWDADRSELRFITPRDLKNWKVTRQQVDACAEKNMTALVAGHKLAVRGSGKERIVLLECPEVPFHASLFLSDGFKKAMKATLGLPVYVALPDRETMIIIPAASRSLIPLLRKDILDDYKTQSHPITTEVLEVSASGIRVYKNLADGP